MSADEDIVVDVTVRNTGDRTGLFLAGGRIEGYPELLDISVPPGETKSEALTFDGQIVGSTDARIHFSYPGGTERFEVAIDGDS